VKLPPEQDQSDGPNLTPVIDVVFLLLIFFLVATRFDQEERELPIELPEVVEAQPIAMTQGLVINVSDVGTVKVVGTEYTHDELAQIIRVAKGNNPHQTALIRADGNGALKHTAEVMGVCNREKMDYRIAVLQKN
jgi:biopolymer transport protein ExbD